MSKMSSCWGVLSLYVIPVGGGIPAGVLLAKSRGIGIGLSSVLYFISDCLLACVFDPAMHFFSGLGKRSEGWRRFSEAWSHSMRRTIAGFGTAGGPLSLILISFGVDPMTGRLATAIAGHGFLSGWALAITGDMFYFWLIMFSTLSLNSVIGNGAVTTVVMLLAMFFVPSLIRRWRERRGQVPASP